VDAVFTLASRHRYNFSAASAESAPHLQLDENKDVGMLGANADFHAFGYCSEPSTSYKAISSCPMPS
jgi:hypothetical protein